MRQLRRKTWIHFLRASKHKNTIHASASKGAYFSATERPVGNLSYYRKFYTCVYSALIISISSQPKRNIFWLQIVNGAWSTLRCGTTYKSPDLLVVCVESISISSRVVLLKTSFITSYNWAYKYVIYCKDPESLHFSGLLLVLKIMLALIP